MTWVCAPPSDHDLKLHGFLALVCGEGAEIVFAEPWMTVLVNGSGRLCAVERQIESARAGVQRHRRRFAGRAAATRCRVRPPESVAVSRSSRYDGYSWSGAVKMPPATPVNVWIGCVWQLDGQWWRIRPQLSLDAGSGPSCASVALPANLITSPTFQVVPAAGAVIVAVGGRVADADRAPPPCWMRRRCR